MPSSAFQGTGRIAPATGGRVSENPHRAIDRSQHSPPAQQHPAVEQQSCISVRIMRGSNLVSVFGRRGHERSGIRRTLLCRMALVAEQSGLLEPVDLHRFGMKAVALDQAALPNAIRKTGWLAGSPVVFASLVYGRITPPLDQEHQQLGGVDECYLSEVSCCNATVLTVEI